MATANFYTENASKIYAIINDDQYYNGDEVIEDLREHAKYLNEDYKDRTGGDNNRSFPSVSIAERHLIDATISGYDITLFGTLCARNGYYTGCNLDYDIEVWTNGSTYHLNDYCNIDDMADDIIDDLGGYISCYDMARKGAFAMNKKSLTKKVHALIYTACEQMENDCSKLCDQTLVCQGIFSNGEAVYALANA